MKNCAWATKNKVYCSMIDCPSTKCEKKINVNDFKESDVITVADFSGVCKYYIGLIVSKVETEGKSK